jgi:archaellum component FlaC
MKDPKALFPLLFASSWLGNLLLTILAFYLAFSHEGPLTPLVFLTVALCILSGNALPISVYLIMIRWRGVELEAESTEVNLRVREALIRSEEVIARLDETEGSLAKGILVTRQVPERIRESLESVQELADKMNTMELSSFTEAMKGQSNAAEAVKGSVEDLVKTVKLLEADLAAVGKDVRKVPSSMGKLGDEITNLAKKSAKPNEDEVPVAERLDMVFESLESVQDSLDGLLAKVAILAQPPQVAEPDIQQPEPDSDPQEQDVEDTLETAELEESEDVEEPPEDVAEPDLEPAAEEIQEQESEEDGEVDSPGIEEDADPVQEEEEPEPAEEPEQELELVSEEEPFELSDGRTRLIAHAMIGMSNKLFIRGDEPWLSWDDGQQMELIGIGEFAWSIDDLREPIDVTVLLNDDLAAHDGTVTLEPGKTIRINPTFPKD